MAGVIQFALGGSVGLQSRSRPGFSRLARNGLFFGVDSDFALVPMAANGLHFRAAAARSRESSDDGGIGTDCAGYGEPC
jgi:hypothetical protein